MINEPDFVTLIEAAADLDDVRQNRYFAFQTSSENRRFHRYVKGWAALSDRATAKGCLALEEWANSGVTGGLRLRNRTKLPRWANEVRRMLCYLSRCDLSRKGLLIYRMTQPVMAYAHATLQQRLREERSEPLPPKVLQCFARQLEHSLARTLKRCLDRHWQAFANSFRCVFREQGEIQPAQIEREFIGEHAGRRLVELLQDFPVLAKLWSNLIGDWLEKVIELNTRLNEDRHSLRRAFFPSGSPGELVGVRLNISDPHNGGRETIILRFRNGQVVYKPRCGRSETDWFSFVRWINRQGFAPSFRTLRFLQRCDYYWMEYVEHLPCRSKSEVHQYFRRAGGLVCAAYLLGAIDCHRDNLIASRDQPILIDTETLFHPETVHHSQDNDSSVIRTGLLPMSKRPNCSYDEVGAFAVASAGRHSATLRRELVFASSYSTDVLCGFRDMWNIIGEPCTKTGAAFRRRLRRLSNRPWRRLYRSTRSYLEVCDRSLDPGLLSSGLGRSRAIALALLRPDVSAPVILQEISAIGRLDVPYFLEPPSENPPGAGSLSLPGVLAHVSSVLL